MNKELIAHVLTTVNTIVSDKEEMLRNIAFGNTDLEYTVDLSGTDVYSQGVYKVHISMANQVISLYVDSYLFRYGNGDSLQVWSDGIYADYIIKYYIISQELALKTKTNEFSYNDDYLDGVLNFETELSGTHFLNFVRIVDYGLIKYFRHATLYCNEVYCDAEMIAEYKTRKVMLEADLYKLPVNLSKESHILLLKLFKYIQELNQYGDVEDTDPDYEDKSWYPGMIDEFTDELDYVESCEREYVDKKLPGSDVANKINIEFMVSLRQSDEYVAKWMNEHIDCLYRKYGDSMGRNNCDIEIKFFKETISTIDEGGNEDRRTEYLPEYYADVEDIDNFSKFYYIG